MKKIFEFLTGDLFKGASDLIDNVVTTKAEKMKLRNAMYALFLSSALDSQRLRAGIIEVEAKGNWLQRSWRPILMLSFGFIIIFNYAVYPVLVAFNPDLPVLPILSPDFWDLMKIGIGGYVVGRSAEKIIPQLGITITKKDKNANI